MGWKDEPADLPRLLKRCRQGDSVAWGELVEQLQRLVYSIPKRMGLNDDDANDVFQATFLALYRSLDRIDNAQTLPKWVAVTASRESMRLRRISSRTVSTGGVDERGLEELVADEDAGAEVNAVHAVETLEVRQALVKLGGKCQALLTLLYADDEASYQEISEKLSMPVGAIGPTRSRCLDKLRKILVASDFFE